MLQRRKRYKNRTILGYKTLAVGSINMAEVSSVWHGPHLEGGGFSHHFKSSVITFLIEKCLDGFHATILMLISIHRTIF